MKPTIGKIGNESKLINFITWERARLKEVFGSLDQNGCTKPNAINTKSKKKNRVIGCKRQVISY